MGLKVKKAMRTKGKSLDRVKESNLPTPSKMAVSAAERIVFYMPHVSETARQNLIRTFAGIIEQEVQNEQLELIGEIL